MASESFAMSAARKDHAHAAWRRRLSVDPQYAVGTHVLLAA